MRKEMKGDRFYELCDAFGMSRQAHYKWLSKQKRCFQETEIIVHEVKRIRYFHPHMGGKKLHFLITKKIKELGFSIGRDRFFNLLSSKGLMAEATRKVATTTISRKALREYENLICGIKLTATNQAWAFDITYLRLTNEFRYMAMVTDLFSHKIIGYHIADTLASDITIKTLKMALKQAGEFKELIHHSDNGLQYESNEYRNILQKAGIRISRAAKRAAMGKWVY